MDDADGVLPALVQPAGCTAAFFVLLAVVGLVYRLLAEWQRRVTLDRLLTKAPGGSVILQEKSVAGPAIQVWVGDACPPIVEGPRSAPRDL
ncbi:hypothetical protein SAMN05421812_114248 [Asanoa hainanensis]|uniref:Uncharacterized protein n=1 Tax=Asanoa hainanensis TaxID=560556 RepID=A0A239P7G7_9ACTN|nr:hypothetical protein [Asanoa hainanensis]SNT63000.1 hypothetical protein SAMN05421812_114248 [Asanoa hainanensis]